MLQHGASQGLEGGLALFNNAQAAKRITCCSRQGGRRRKQMGEGGKRRREGRAKPGHQAGAQGASGGHGDLLAQNGAHSQLEPVQGARHSHPLAAREVAVQTFVDGLWVGIDVKPCPHAGHHVGQHGVQRIAHLHLNPAARGVKCGVNPAGVGHTAHAQGQRSGEAGGVGVWCGLFQPRDLAGGEELHHGGHVIGGAVRQCEPKAGALRIDLGRGDVAAQSAGVELVVLRKHRIEAPYAGEPAQSGDLLNRKLRVREPMFRTEQAAGLQVLKRRDTEAGLKNSAHMAVTDAQAVGQPLNARRRIAPALGRVQPLRGLTGQDVGGVLNGPSPFGRAGGNFRPAPQTGPKPGTFGLSCQTEKTTVLPLGRTHAAYGSAINAGRGDAGEKRAVKPRVFCFQSQVAGVVLGGGGGLAHGLHDRRVSNPNPSPSSRFRTCPCASGPLQSPQKIQFTPLRGSLCSYAHPSSRPTTFVALFPAQFMRKWQRHWGGPLGRWRARKAKPKLRSDVTGA